MARKIKPIERTLNFTLPKNATSFIDSAYVLAWMNRQAMRQGMEYVIESLEIFGVTGSNVSVNIQTLSKNWISSNSWVKGFSHWKQQQKEYLLEAGQSSKEARYNDFKIYYSAEHSSSNTLLPMNTVTEAGAQVTDPTVDSQWVYSQVVVPNDGAVGTTNEYECHMMGPDLAAGAGDRKGLIHNYALSRQRPQVYDPNIVGPSTDGGLYQDMVDDGDDLEKVGQNVSTNNFAPPYLVGNESQHEWYPGGANNPLAGSTIRDILTIRSGTGAFASDSTGAFTALCGLIAITNLSETDDLALKITWAPGDYKGVMARSMQDVN